MAKQYIYAYSRFVQYSHRGRRMTRSILQSYTSGGNWMDNKMNITTEYTVDIGHHELHIYLLVIVAARTSFHAYT